MIAPINSVVTMISAFTIGSSIYSISDGSGRLMGCQSDHFSICLVDLVDNSRCCRYKVQIIFSLKTLLNDLKMKKSKETTAETKAKCNGCLRLKEQRSVV